jgi:hypothetical protein
MARCGASSLGIHPASPAKRASNRLVRVIRTRHDWKLGDSTSLIILTMDRDLGVADLRGTGLQVAGSIVRIVAVYRAAVVHLRNIGDNGELGYVLPLSVAARMGELAGCDALLPVGGLEMMDIALGDRHVVVIVLQLCFSVVVEEPVEQFLVIRSANFVSVQQLARHVV